MKGNKPIKSDGRTEGPVHHTAMCKYSENEDEGYTDIFIDFIFYSRVQ